MKKILIKRLTASLCCICYIMLFLFSVITDLRDETIESQLLSKIFDALFSLALAAYLYSVIANKIVFAKRALLLLTFFIIGFLIKSLYFMFANVTPFMQELGVNWLSAVYYTFKSFLFYSFPFWLIFTFLLSLGYFGLCDLRKIHKKVQLSDSRV